MGGSLEALPYVQKYSDQYSYTQMSHSQMRYLNYFDQILLKGFIPVTRALNLDKIVIVFDAKAG